MMSVLLPEELTKIEEQQMLNFMQANSDSKIVKCECGGVMEVFPG